MRIGVLTIVGSVAVVLFGSVPAASPSGGRLLESATEMASETRGADSSGGEAFAADKVTPEQLRGFGRGLERIAGSVVAGTCNPFDLCGDSDCEPWCNPLCSAFDTCRCSGCVTCPCMAQCTPQCNPICSQFNLCACNGRCSPLCPTAACDPACVNPACVPVCPQFSPCVCLGPCNPTCPSALCNAQCGTHPECNPVCGGNGCNAGCPTFCACPQNLCNPACGDPDCNVLCGGSLCALNCESSRCTAACPENQACQPVCGGDPCSLACYATLTGKEKFCDANLCPTNHRCSELCGDTGDPCASGCPDRCTPGLCTENSICDRECGGDPCGDACASYEATFDSNLDLFCNQSLCPTNSACNLLCGGDPCASGCPDECDPVICTDNVACAPQCGSDPCGDGCASALHFERFCDQDLCPTNYNCNLICGGDPCASGCPDECNAGLCYLPACQTHCGGDPCSESCAAAEGYATISLDAYFCNPSLCPLNDTCDILCGGDPCDLRCPDACTVLCASNLNCETFCSGDPNNFGCPDVDCSTNPCQNECLPICGLTCPQYSFCACQAALGNNTSCLSACGGDPCNSGCPLAGTCACDPCGAGCDPCRCIDPGQPDCNGNKINDSCDVARFDQWANQVLAFSSQFSDPDWAASQALGPPNAPDYCDCTTSWAPGPLNGTHEFIIVGFAQAVHASGVTIHETFGHGFVYQVDLLDTTGSLHTVFSGVDPSTPPSANFVVAFAPTPYLAQGVKIYVDTDHNLNEWEEIDAVRLHSQRPSAHSADTNLDDVPDECQSYDCDGNGAVDAGDWRCIVHCLHGPNQEAPYGCNRSDVNGDHDVDLDDVARYLNTLTPP